METLIQDILFHALTPTTLISGVGLMMLCMTNRYNHTTDRIRKLIQKRETSGLSLEPTIDDEIRHVFRRAASLRHAMLCIASSAVSSSLLIATSVASHFTETDLTALATLWLVLSLCLIATSVFFFFREVWLSTKALSLALESLPGKRKAHYARFY